MALDLAGLDDKEREAVEKMIAAGQLNVHATTCICGRQYECMCDFKGDHGINFCDVCKQAAPFRFPTVPFPTPIAPPLAPWQTVTADPISVTAPPTSTTSTNVWKLPVTYLRAAGESWHAPNWVSYTTVKGRGPVRLTFVAEGR